MLEQIQQIVAEYPVLALLQTALTIWMLVDALQRHDGERYWVFVILFMPFVGAWVYFFVIYVPRIPPGRLSSLFQHRPSLDELRYRVEQTPTLTNHVVLAQRLMEKKEFDQALPHLQAAQKKEPEHGLVLYTIAKCHVEQGNPDLAIPMLQSFIARDRLWSNYAAWRLLVQAQAATGDPAAAVQTCRELARLAGTLEYKCLLAEHLLTAGLTEEMRGALDGALREYNFSRGPIRRRNARWARKAKGLLKQADARPSAR